MATITINLTDTQLLGLQYLGVTAEDVIAQEIAPIMDAYAKPIPGYGEKYRVFPGGEIWAEGNGKNFKRGRFLKDYDSFGYRRVFLRSKDGYDSYMVHRLVAEAYIGNPEGKPYVNHKNGLKHDNRVANLEWVTTSENAKHRFDVLGHKTHNRSLTDDQASDIRKKLANGRTRDQLAAEYKVNRSVIKQIDLGVTYKEQKHA
jgi:hypothetical protein